MKRTLFICVAFFLAGIYGAALLPAEMLWLVILISCCLLLCFPFVRAARMPFLLVFLFLLGALRMAVAEDISSRELYPYLDEYITVTGQVTEYPVQDAESGQVVLYAELREMSFLEEQVSLKERVRLTVSKGETVPQFGENFRAVCRLRIPDGSMNEGGFHYERYLKTKKIFFIGYLEKGTVEVTGTYPLGLSEHIYLLNQNCKNVIARYVPGDGAALLQAISLGNKTAMSEKLTKELQVSGLSHMTAVSGMHVSVLVSALYMFYALFRQNRNRYVWLTVAVVLCFMVFTGASFSVIRASVMCLMTLVAYCIFRKEDALTSLAFSAGVIVAINPFAGYDIGFLLSFGATLGILLFASPLEASLSECFGLTGEMGKIKGIAKKFLSVFAVSVSAQIFVLPLASFLFGTFSAWAILSNLLTWMLAPVLLVSGLLSGILGLFHLALGYLPAAFGYPFVKLFLAIVRFFGNRTEGLMTIGAFGSFRLYLYLLLGACLYHLIRKRYVFALIPLCSALLLFGISSFGMVPEPIAEITFINVGQGDCSLLSLPGDNHILIDAGGVPDYAGGYDVGSQVVLPFLQKRGITQLDYMVASHGHEDHILGLMSVLDAIKVDTLLVPVGFEESENGQLLLAKAEHYGVKLLALDAGDSVSFSEIGHFQVLHPGEETFSENENDSSLVLLFCFGNTKTLFMGDLESAGETHLIEENRISDVDILKVAHHGSATSSCSLFLKRARPEYAYIPCGENQYGHPAPSVLQNLESCGVTIYRADVHKDVSFLLDTTGIQMVRKGADNHEN